MSGGAFPSLLQNWKVDSAKVRGIGTLSGVWGAWLICPHMLRTRMIHEFIGISAWECVSLAHVHIHKPMCAWLAADSLV